MKRFVVQDAGLFKPESRDWLVRDTEKNKTVRVYKSLKCALKRAEKLNQEASCQKKR